MLLALPTLVQAGEGDSAKPPAAQKSAAPAIPPTVSAEKAPAQTSPKRTMGSVTVRTAKEGVPIYIDGELVGLSPLPGPWMIPVGAHEIEARPEGAPPDKRAVEIAAGDDVPIDLLVSPPKSNRPMPARVVRTGPGFSLSTAGYVAGGVGIAAGIASAIFGAGTLSSLDDAQGYDRTEAGHDRAGYRDIEHGAERSAFLANVSAGVAVTSLAVGTLLILLADDRPDGQVTVSPSAAGAAVGGRF